MNAALSAPSRLSHFLFLRRNKRVVHSIYVGFTGSCFYLSEYHIYQHLRLFSMQNIPASPSRSLRVALEGCVGFYFRLGYSDIDILA